MVNGYPRGIVKLGASIRDDSVVFCEVPNVSCATLQANFKTYENGSGQMINYTKSAVTLRYNCGVDSRILIIRNLGISHDNVFGFTYFGG
ncbi:hypothetical protein EZV62_004282 [Acer yangbiense]|uniref:Uncharacterized protein n=1 Tax=Acer yangbiense TaxID=1000413 RepID=A0A5C7IIZ5_9ROSI|nr:hypothetical protein EZV62_004282 [Acer yangbiense]